jgi:RND family efflux transporter MFP subunit
MTRRIARSSLLIPAGLLAISCGGGHEPRSTESLSPVAAPVATVAETPSSTALEATAGIEPYRRATPGTVLMGRVEAIQKREGDPVRAGDVLARIASGDVAARRAQAEAAVSAAGAMEENARRTRDRVERLHARQAASDKNLEDAVAGHAAALAQLRAAEEGVRAAAVYVDYAAVKAPFDGVVTRRNVEKGDMAAPGMPLFVVEDLARMKAVAEVPESAVAGLRTGAPAEVVVTSLGSAVRAGVVDEILPAADPRSRTFTVRIVLDNGDGALRSGMFARLRLPGDAGSSSAAVSVPEGAVVRRGPLTGVFTVDDGGVARLRWVTLGTARDGSIEVLTGLAAGERIVTAPPADLEDGRAVASTGASR